MRLHPLPLRRIALACALFALPSCLLDTDGNSSGSAGAGAGQATTFGNEDLEGTWVLKVNWDDPDLDSQSPTLLVFGVSNLGGPPPLVEWSDDMGNSFMDRILASDVDLAMDGEFVFWAHYFVPETDLLGTFLLVGRMTAGKLRLLGRGNSHGASGDPEAVTNAWNEDFSWSLEFF